MRGEERRTLKVIAGVIALGALAPVLFLASLFVIGGRVAPQQLAPATTPAPPLVKDALWARAEGGRATNLRPIGPITAAQMAACVLTAPGDNDNQRIAACRHVMPALPALEYLSGVLLRDHGIHRHSFRGGAGAMVTTVRLTRTWTRDELLNTLAERADFGYGWRGIEAAAHGFFGRPAAALTLSHAALLASRVGDRSHTDPWCDPETAAAMRNRVLARMHEDGSITEADWQAAQTAALGLGPPPQGRPACQE